MTHSLQTTRTTDGVECRSDDGTLWAVIAYHSDAKIEAAEKEGLLMRRWVVIFPASHSDNRQFESYEAAEYYALAIYIERVTRASEAADLLVSATEA